ncbi:hypothetical protein FHETE_10616 [Fusarium heterosporum]|uniref:Uncharacterized protein n=1 Tax=Fusarium heterosporum TaxID=42747 RepID=A0A8H5WEM0_FUSHE|nr:hypothetical protein FHETE_10616 [Fusarium heterosporum]
MITQAQVIKAPQRLQSQDTKNKIPSIFLAGITTDTGQPDWRETLTSALSDRRVTIFNPARSDWDETWEEKFSDRRWKEQIRWELDMQEAADIVVFFFHQLTVAPISLLELGLAIKNKKVIVCAHDDYEKRGNIEAVCIRFGAKLVSTEDELRQALLLSLDEV